MLAPLDLLTTSLGPSGKSRADVLASSRSRWDMGWGGARASLPPLLFPNPWVCAHWCSIWKLRCPLNQSMKSEGSTLQVAASCQEWAGHG